MLFLYSPLLFLNFKFRNFFFKFSPFLSLFLLYLSHAKIPRECTILSDFSLDHLIVTCPTLSLDTISTAKWDCQYTIIQGIYTLL